MHQLTPTRRAARWERRSSANQKQVGMYPGMVWEAFDSTQDDVQGKRRVCARLRAAPKVNYAGYDETSPLPSKQPLPAKKKIVVLD